MNLPPVPNPPDGVKYALTVPQSVLFAELSLQGNLRSSFATAMRIDYEPEYIIIDDGAMSWNYDSDGKFTSALLFEGSIALAIGKFISIMESTSRVLDRVSRILPSKATRRPEIVEDLIEDLEAYWYAYKLQMTSLFTFWNAEYLLSSALAESLINNNRYDEIKQGLARFLRPYEPNYFLIERKQLEKLSRRFIKGEPKASSYTINSGPVSDTLVKALYAHSETFGFLLAPFNIGSPPSLEYLMERIMETSSNLSSNKEDSPLMLFNTDSFEDLPSDVRKLGELTQRFTFWKSERLDILSLCDARVQSLYKEASAFLSISLDQLFTLTSKEIIESLRAGSITIDEETRQSRSKAFCLVLNKGEITFCHPSRVDKGKEADKVGSVGTVLKGIGASPGVITGRARVIINIEDLGQLELGDILITGMTRPEMGAALDRAGAFVTDEGGLMCHAAIISREMGKPCIIGTENATQVIQSGMILTVDANNGIVTIVQVP